MSGGLGGTLLFSEKGGDHKNLPVITPSECGKWHGVLQGGVHAGSGKAWGAGGRLSCAARRTLGLTVGLNLPFTSSGASRKPFNRSVPQFCNLYSGYTKMPPLRLLCRVYELLCKVLGIVRAVPRAVEMFAVHIFP